MSTEYSAAFSLVPHNHQPIINEPETSTDLLMFVLPVCVTIVVLLLVILFAIIIRYASPSGLIMTNMRLNELKIEANYHRKCS